MSPLFLIARTLANFDFLKNKPSVSFPSQLTFLQPSTFSLFFSLSLSFSHSFEKHYVTLLHHNCFLSKVNHCCFSHTKWPHLNIFDPHFLKILKVKNKNKRYSSIINDVFFSKTNDWSVDTVERPAGKISLVPHPTHKKHHVVPSLILSPIFWTIFSANPHC